MSKNLTDSEIVKALEDILHRIKGAEHLIVQKECVKSLCNGLQNTLSLINRLQAENEEKDKHIMELQAINDSIKGDKAFLGEEITKYHKELLKSKVFKFVRDANRIYNIMDFQDGEILMFYDYPEKASALSKGYLLFKGKEDIRLVNISEVKEISYAEIKAEAYKEFAEELHNKAMKPEDICDNFAVGCNNIDNLLKELVGDDNG